MALTNEAGVRLTRSIIFDNLDLSRNQDENARELIVRLLNLVAKQAADVRDAQAEIQRLRDEQAKELPGAIVY